MAGYCFRNKEIKYAKALEEKHTDRQKVSKVSTLIKRLNFETYTKPRKEQDLRQTQATCSIKRGFNFLQMLRETKFK